jgi:hypothetical protein
MYPDILGGIRSFNDSRARCLRFLKLAFSLERKRDITPIGVVR